MMSAVRKVRSRTASQLFGPRNRFAEHIAHHDLGGDDGLMKPNRSTASTVSARLIRPRIDPYNASIGRSPLKAHRDGLGSDAGNRAETTGEVVNFLDLEESLAPETLAFRVSTIESLCFERRRVDIDNGGAM
jgi:hypothetical protein